MLWVCCGYLKKQFLLQRSPKLAFPLLKSFDGYRKNEWWNLVEYEYIMNKTYSHLWLLIILWFWWKIMNNDYINNVYAIKNLVEICWEFSQWLPCGDRYLQESSNLQLYNPIPKYFEISSESFCGFLYVSGWCLEGFNH